MFKNYFKIAFRNLRKNKAFSAINIFGLSIGMATCLIILLFVRDEGSYDRYNLRADRIFRVVFRASIQGEKIKEGDVMPPVAQAFRSEFPEVQEATRLQTAGSPAVTYGDKSFEEKIAAADSNFFSVFTLPFLRGDAATALLQPDHIVITRDIAAKFFGNEDPMGRTLTIKSWNKTYIVAGVLENVPVNSHFHFDLFTSMAAVPDARSLSWLSSGYYTYLQLPDGYNYKKLEAKFPELVKKYMGPQVHQAFGVGFDDFLKKGNQLGFSLQPLTDIHLHSDMNPLTELEPGGDARYVYIFGAIALFMLVIACINFMNLSTAGAAKRAREVGVRKVLGSMKWELVRQFLAESIFLAIIALLFALVFVYLALPVFNELSGKNLSLHLFANPRVIPELLLFGLLIGVLAGSYPAFFLSSFKPVHVLKGRIDNGRTGMRLRSGLVVFQFMISITLIVSTTVVYEQLQYIQHKKLGYNRDQVLVAPTWKLGDNQPAFRQQLQQIAGVVSVSNSNYLPAGPTNANNFLVYPEGHADQMVTTLRYEVDEQYIPTLGMEMLTGRNFSKGLATDSTSVILNESAVKALGWERHPLDHALIHADNEGKKPTYRVIGVVKDFHFKSLHEAISPLVMTLGQGNSGVTIVKVNAGNIPGLLAAVRDQWASFHSGTPLDYSFLDERFNETYQAEQKTGRILAIFAGLTLFVACLGLFGLATFTAEQRTKEIGIRKVLGANVRGIVSLLSGEFIKLVVIAFLIASPIAWYIMNKWLQDFAYRNPISAWIFVWAALLALAITMITISFQAIRAAIANPIKSLRTE